MSITAVFLIVSLTLAGIQYWQRERHLATILQKLGERDEAKAEVENFYGKRRRKR